ncbi:MAG TPA: hypothetical protein VK506_14115 [Conexibacter sp.]|nr:hypothetical protein [Conexibacter sp.]
MPAVLVESAGWYVKVVQRDDGWNNFDICRISPGEPRVGAGSLRPPAGLWLSADGLKDVVGRSATGTAITNRDVREAQAHEGHLIAVAA